MIVNKIRRDAYDRSRNYKFEKIFHFSTLQIKIVVDFIEKI